MVYLMRAGSQALIKFRGLSLRLGDKSDEPAALCANATNIVIGICFFA